MTGKAKIKSRIEELSTCFNSIEEVSDGAKEVVVKELEKLKNEIQTGRAERKKRTKRA